MTIAELLDVLQDFAAECGPETPVRIAFQPNYPMRAEIQNVTTLDTSGEFDDKQPFIWIAATDTAWGENPYAPESAWETY